MTPGSQLASASILPVWLLNLNLGLRSCVERGREQYSAMNVKFEIALLRADYRRRA
jgi:hypothetical protein